MRTRVMSGLLVRGGSGQVDAEPVGLAFGGRSLLAQPQVQDVEGAGSQAHSADAAVLLGRPQSGVLENAQVLHERRQRHRERCREFVQDSWKPRQPLTKPTTLLIRQSAKDD